MDKGNKMEHKAIDISAKVIQGSILLISSFLFISVAIRKNGLKNNPKVTANAYGNKYSKD